MIKAPCDGYVCNSVVDMIGWDVNKSSIKQGTSSSVIAGCPLERGFADLCPILTANLKRVWQIVHYAGYFLCRKVVSFPDAPLTTREGASGKHQPW